LAVEAAKEAANRGFEVEVVDLRTLKPLDTEAVRRSARKTGRVLVVDEDYLSYGLTGEVAAVLLEDAPTREKLREFARVAIPDVPIPFSEPLEEAVLPSAARITEALRAWE
jgi:pyruvate/2-oxoglutarate/acetoin dehydrogenase E1 component